MQRQLKGDLRPGLYRCLKICGGGSFMFFGNVCFDELLGKMNIFSVRSLKADTESETAVAAFDGVNDLPLDLDQIA